MFGQVELDFLHFLEGIRTPFLSKLAEIITFLGEETIIIVVAAIFYFIIDKKFGQKLIFTICGNVMANGIAKNFAKIQRPFITDPTLHPVRVETATGYSFPSGHTENAAGWLTVVAGWFRKKWAYAVACVLMLLIGFSRTFLGVHYPSDVVAGLLIGVLTALLFGWLFDKWENKFPAFAILIGLYTVFGVIFLISADPQFADYFKMFGFAAGYAAGYPFEKKFANFSNDVPLWKRIIRCAVGLGLALGIRFGLSALFGLISTDVVQIQLLLGMVRYFMISFFCIGLYPWLFTKVKF